MNKRIQTLLNEKETPGAGDGYKKRARGYRWQSLLNIFDQNKMARVRVKDFWWKVHGSVLRREKC